MNTGTERKRREVTGSKTEKEAEDMKLLAYLLNKYIYFNTFKFKFKFLILFKEIEGFKLILALFIY